MDPYLESPDIWSDVHSTLINLFREQLNPQLVPHYLAAYERARYDLRIDYTKPTTPPLPETDAKWVESLLAHRWFMARQISDS